MIATWEPLFRRRLVQHTVMCWLEGSSRVCWPSAHRCRAQVLPSVHQRRTQLFAFASLCASERASSAAWLFAAVARDFDSCSVKVPFYFGELTSRFCAPAELVLLGTTAGLGTFLVTSWRLDVLWEAEVHFREAVCRLLVSTQSVGWRARSVCRR